MSLENWVNWELIASLSLSLSLSVQKQYRLPPGSHPAAVAPLCLWLYRGSTGCLPVAIQQRPCLFLCLCSSSSSYEYLPVAAAPLSLCLCSGYLPASHPATAAAGWLPEGNWYCLCTDRWSEKEARPLLDDWQEASGTAPTQRHSFCCMAAGR